ncbi:MULTISPECIES: hypothetical protein [Paracoccus]|uniref:hypothetical protein n=1 Tax=Paracoccus TaxID=265 RepID=UPI0008698497|nr:MULTISPECIES: hypothetical protein [Paracoccus]ODT60994.1 MAG: hypothetical protein ABS73_03915 [Paracoccus sp. SCN 68-21]
MTMKIEVYIPEDDIRAGAASNYLARAMEAIGYSRGVSLAMPEPRRLDAEDKPRDRAKADDVPDAVSDVSEKATDEPVDEVHIVRERGKPAPGKARRTKAEIEEDEAADFADQQVGGREIANADIEPKPAISTGAERVSPEDDAQDAADEAADPANATAAEPTRDDVRAAMMAYGQKMGMDRLTTDLLAILNSNFPAGNVTKLSEIPEDAAAFRLVIDALTAKMEG